MCRTLSTSAPAATMMQNRIDNNKKESSIAKNQTFKKTRQHTHKKKPSRYLWTCDIQAVWDASYHLMCGGWPTNCFSRPPWWPQLQHHKKRQWDLQIVDFSFLCRVGLLEIEWPINPPPPSLPLLPHQHQLQVRLLRQVRQLTICLVRPRWCLPSSSRALNLRIIFARYEWATDILPHLLAISVLGGNLFAQSLVVINFLAYLLRCCFLNDPVRKSVSPKRHARGCATYARILWRDCWQPGVF